MCPTAHQAQVEPDAFHGAEPLGVGSWIVDPEGSSVEFKIRHLLVKDVWGRFKGFAGQLERAADGSLRASGSVSIETVDTGDRVRDEHLLGDGFFDAAAYPEMRFVSTTIQATASGLLEILGQLTIRGETHPIEIGGRFTGTADGRIRLKLKSELSRSRFGIESQNLLESGVSDRVRLSLSLLLVRPQAT